jgi:hypothetical protein
MIKNNANNYTTILIILLNWIIPITSYLPILFGSKKYPKPIVKNK